MDPMKKHPTAKQAAKLLCISREQVFKLIRQGKLRRGPVAKINRRWHTTVMIDAQFNAQREARGLKPIFPESKQPPRLVLFEREKKPFAPNLNPNLNPNPALEDTLGKARNAMNICLEAQKACEEASRQLKTATCTAAKTVNMPAEPQPAFLMCGRSYLTTWCLPMPALHIRHNTATFNFDGEAERLDKLVARAESAADYVMTSGAEHEETITRCTAILAAACILQLILAAYYTLCHLNII